MSILSSSDYPTIRAAIDTSLDSTVLPDATIALPIFVTAAELEVVARDPQAASRTGDAATHIKNACIYLTAARLAPAVPQISGETTVGKHTYTRKLQDIDEQVANLRAMAESALAAAVDSTASPASPEVPTFFGRACGGRGR